MRFMQTGKKATTPKVVALYPARIPQDQPSEGIFSARNKARPSR